MLELCITSAYDICVIFLVCVCSQHLGELGAGASLELTLSALPVVCGLQVGGVEYGIVFFIEFKYLYRTHPHTRARSLMNEASNLIFMFYFTTSKFVHIQVLNA